MGDETRALRALLASLGLSTWAVEELLAQVAPPLNDVDDEAPIYPISTAARLADMHPQTLRQYDRLGLVVPGRTRGGGRRYSGADVRRLREVQRLSQEEGINLAGISRIMELSRRVEALERETAGLRAVLSHLASLRNRVFAADRLGRVTEYVRGQRPVRESSGTLVRYRAPGAVVVWSETSTAAAARIPRD